ncbi:MAG TPA: hypothetical protein DCP28_01850 [Cytophagales bacterium]|nr:hypothetical protein [Cytophagales bacterium]
MTSERMLKIIDALVPELQQQGNAVFFEYEEVPMMLVYDESADRMRIVSPIIEVSRLEEGMLEKAMQANFHQALDARYAISEGLVWSAFIHPLSDLSSELLRSGIHQVAVAHVTFGGQYTSGALVFGGEEGQR